MRIIKAVAMFFLFTGTIAGMVYIGMHIANMLAWVD